MLRDSPARAWVEVNLEAIAHNLNVARQILPETLLMPVIKAGAYGHGLEQVARRLDNEAVEFFGLANVAEARQVQRAGIRTKSFLLSPSLADEREEIVAHQWGTSLSSIEEAAHFNALAEQYGRKLSLHLNIDTGMGREGFLPDDLSALVEQIRSFSHLSIEGVMSHMSSADEDINFTQQQIGLYSDCVEYLAQHFNLKYRHLAASAGKLAYQIPVANLARPGLMLYGVSPIASIYDAQLRPTLRLCSRVTLVRELPAGHGVSYGRSAITKSPTRVATLGIGYADGWCRSLSNTAVSVEIRGEACPTLGRVTMDQIMVDVSALPEVRSGDEVLLFGGMQSVSDVARLAGTIAWDVFVGLGTRLPRIYT